MDSLKHALSYQWLGLAVWCWLLLVLTPVADLIVKHTKSITAESLLEAVANALKASPLYLIPSVKALLDVFASEAPPAPPVPPVVAAGVIPQASSR